MGGWREERRRRLWGGDSAWLYLGRVDRYIFTVQMIALVLLERRCGFCLFSQEAFGVHSRLMARFLDTSSVPARSNCSIVGAA